MRCCGLQPCLRLTPLAELPKARCLFLLCTCHPPPCRSLKGNNQALHSSIFSSDSHPGALSKQDCHERLDIGCKIKKGRASICIYCIIFKGISHWDSVKTSLPWLSNFMKPTEHGKVGEKSSLVIGKILLRGWCLRTELKPGVTPKRS